MKMKMKLLGLVSALSVALFAAAPVQAKEEKVSLRLGFELSLESSQGVGAKEMASVANKLSKGRIEIQLFPDSQLANDAVEKVYS
jgi:TRAP-type C4-dicarboxylate transport system substrate-binding protein